MADSEIQAIAQETTQIVLSEFLAGAKEELQKTQIDAQQVVNALLEFSEVCTRYYELRNNLKKQSKKGISTLPNLQKQKIDLQEEAYDKLFIAQNLFNNYFGQHMQMIFVTDDQQLILIDNSREDILRNQYGGLQYALSKIKEVQGILKELIADDDYDPSLLKITNLEVNRRWDIAIATHRKKQHLPILWKSGQGWLMAYVNNKGTIAEAYANFFINKFKFSGQLEPDVGTYVTNETYGMRAVDNTSGFVVGDVQAGDNNFVQFGIKKEGASLMGLYKINSIIKSLQQKMIDSPAETLEELRKIMSSPGTAKQVTQAIEVNIESATEKVLNTLQEYK